MRIVYLLLCLSLFSPLALAQPGIIETVAGDGNFVQSGDGGPATSAGLGSSHSVAVDAAGNLYIDVNWPARVRRVAPDGIITTIAGTSGSGNDPTVQRFAIVAGVAAHRVVATDELVRVIGAPKSAFHPGKLLRTERPVLHHGDVVAPRGLFS